MQPSPVLGSARPIMKFWISIGARLNCVVYRPVQLEIGRVPSLTVPLASSEMEDVVADVLVSRNGPVPPTEQLVLSAIPAVQATALAGPSVVRSKLRVPTPGAPLKTMNPSPDVTLKVRSL